MSKRTSQNGINLIKGFEGCRLRAYQDSVGVWTIGYGHTSSVYCGQVITQAQAESLLKTDLVSRENVINQNVKVPINQNQFDALVSFVYNLGAGNFLKSDLLKYLNKSQYTKAANEFVLWSYAGGKKLAGLVKRRTAEKALFMKEVDDEMVESSKMIVNGKQIIVKRILKDGTNYIAIRDIADDLGYNISNNGSIAVLTKR